MMMKSGRGLAHAAHDLDREAHALLGVPPQASCAVGARRE
jgi:hypothetical protein